MVAPLSFKKKENEYEPTSNVKNHKNLQKSKNPKIQKYKNPKIQKPKVSWEIVRRFLDFWIFGFLDFWIFGFLDFYA